MSPDHPAADHAHLSLTTSGLVRPMAWCAKDEESDWWHSSITLNTMLYGDRETTIVIETGPVIKPVRLLVQWFTGSTA